MKYIFAFQHWDMKKLPWIIHWGYKGHGPQKDLGAKKAVVKSFYTTVQGLENSGKLGFNFLI